MVMEAAAVPAPVAPTRPKWLIPVAAVVVLATAAGIYFATRPKGPSFPLSITTPTGEMVLVPSGPFLSGEAKQSAAALPAFYIDKTEVSNGAYASFCNATQRKLPDNFSEDSKLPVVNVSILDAQAFAKWAGKRLPTAREWEKAARGTDGRTFPWGNDQDPSKANVDTKQLRTVTEFSSGASPFGVLNLVGNVWEFVEQLSTPSKAAVDHFRESMTPPPGDEDPWYQIRGLSNKEPWNSGAVWDSGTIPARWKAADIGFRCVQDPH